MYRRAGLVALSLFGTAVHAQNNKCWTCSENTPITDLTNSNGQCYFVSTLDQTDPAKFVDCDGSCFVKYESKDGILQSVTRGCMAATVGDTTGDTGFDFFLGEPLNSDGAAITVADLTATSQLCDVDTKTGTLLHFNGNTFDPNQDQNELTDVTCASICKADSDTVACNNNEVTTLSDCSGKCHDPDVCTCDHWTGKESYKCGFVSEILGYTERPVENADGAYECVPYECSCTNKDTDGTTDVAIAGAKCYGNGEPSSTATCSCTDIGTATTNTDTLDTTPYFNGQFLDTTIADDTKCSPVTCTPGCGAKQQCQHAKFSKTGSCKCTTKDDVLNSDKDDCETPAAVNPKCQQCSSDLESGSACAGGTAEATSCAKAGAKCAAVSTLWVNAEGKSIREVVERGCSDDAVVKDTCEFQTISSTALSAEQSSEFKIDGTVTEITCRYVCDDKDNCNSELADGIDEAEPAKRKCNEGTVCTGVTECKDISDFSADVTTKYTPGTECANIDGKQAYCYAHMDYLEHLRFDGVYERSLVRLEYKCQTEADAETKELDANARACTPSAIGISSFTNFAAEPKTNNLEGLRGNVMMHSCMTVCDTDNCNNAWPGQPTCYECDSAEDEETDGTLKTEKNPDHCFTDVEMSKACDMYYHNACFVTQSGLDLTSNWAQKSMNPYSAMQSMGAYKKIKRGCEVASTEGPIEGMKYTRDGDQNQHAYSDRMYLCKTNSCNFGPALPTPEN